VLTIKNIQLNEFALNAQEKFISRLYQILYIQHSREDVANSFNDDEALALIRASVLKAMSFNINTEVHIAKFVAFELLYGSKFNCTSKYIFLEKILTNKSVDPAVRLQQVFEYMCNWEKF
jgi:hypothetical protein